ncbi:FkbM family methyltransferase [Mangrovicoccus ximenensis]|uniref:FkbM family methyltransferase n=1 Tax=Mangrovicoccus ximenensis TaxID=1911570 RepID=UPI001374E69E|nr:FkbM family methyltransferase [Mangrovicoccus ximenensis]
MWFRRLARQARYRALSRYQYYRAGQLKGRAKQRRRDLAKALLKVPCDLEFRDAMEAARGLPAVDLGANFGEVAQRLAETASVVHAFEPDPWTASRLRANVGHLPNVVIHEAAAGAEAGEIELFRHVDFDESTGRHCESATVVAAKDGADRGNSVRVPMLAVPEFLETLGPEIGILKIDIEGAEVALMEALLEHPVLARVRYVFVETHEDKIPELAARTAALKRRVRWMRHPHVNMNWW